MKVFLLIAGKTSYSTHVAIILDKTFIHYTWSGVLCTKQDFLVEPVWVRDIEVGEFEINSVLERVLLLKKILKPGFGKWWFKAFLWLFNREQYICTNFICSALGYKMDVGLTPDELFSWLSDV